MEEKTIDRAAMGRLAKALVFVCGPDHPTTVALQAAAESGSERDIKNARTLFHEVYGRWQRDLEGLWAEAAEEIDWIEPA